MSNSKNSKYKLTKEGENILRYCEKIMPEVEAVIEADSRLREYARLTA